MLHAEQLLRGGEICLCPLIGEDVLDFVPGELFHLDRLQQHVLCECFHIDVEFGGFALHSSRNLKVPLAVRLIDFDVAHGLPLATPEKTLALSRHRGLVQQFLLFSLGARWHVELPPVFVRSVHYGVESIALLEVVVAWLHFLRMEVIVDEKVGGFFGVALGKIISIVGGIKIHKLLLLPRSQQSSANSDRALRCEIRW